jgi:hypothetical protein
MNLLKKLFQQIIKIKKSFLNKINLIKINVLKQIFIMNFNNKIKLF